MRQIKARAAAAPRQMIASLTWSLLALMSLVLLLAPRAGNADAGAGDLRGRWISDKTQPDMDYQVSAGPSGKLVVTVPAKAVGRAKGEAVTLERIGPGEFATPKGGEIHASFKVTDPRHAEFKMMINRPNAFNVTDQLLERP